MLYSFLSVEWNFYLCHRQQYESVHTFGANDVIFQSKIIHCNVVGMLQHDIQWHLSSLFFTCTEQPQLIGNNRTFIHSVLDFSGFFVFIIFFCTLLHELRFEQCKQELIPAQWYATIAIGTVYSVKKFV